MLGWGLAQELCPCQLLCPGHAWSLCCPADLCVVGRWGTYGHRKNASQSLETACNWFLPSTSCGRGLDVTLECGHGMHNPSCHHGADPSMCRDGSGLQGVSLGTAANAQGVQMEFESSPNIPLPLFSSGAKILPPYGQAPLLDNAAFPCELSIGRSSRTDLPQTRSLSLLLSYTLPISNNCSY